MNRQVLHNRYSTNHETFPGTCRPRACCCLRCGGNLQEGFLLDPPQGFEPAIATTWQAGGAENQTIAGVSVDPARQRRVVARRCDDCGGLELFAP